MSDLADCRAACVAANPFTSPTHSLADSLIARQRLDAAQVAEWRCGGCCGDRGDDGACRSIAVRLARQGKLKLAGFSAAAAKEAAELCEQRREYWDSLGTPLRTETDAARAVTWQAWAEKFILYFGADDNDDDDASFENRGRADQG